jgi:hypothetical protein
MDDPDTVFSDSTGCKLRISRVSDFSDDKYVEWCTEGAGNFGSDGDASAGQSEDGCESIQCERSDAFGKFLAGFTAIPEHSVDSWNVWRSGVRSGSIGREGGMIGGF